jgi:hypothetical protein
VGAGVGGCLQYGGSKVLNTRPQVTGQQPPTLGSRSLAYLPVHMLA